MLQLEYYFFPSFNFEADPDFTGEKADLIDLSSLEVKYLSDMKDDGRFAINLFIRGPESATNPYEISMHAFGIFSYTPLPGKDIENAHLAAVVVRNGVNLLYTASREFLMTATGRGPYGSVVLPARVFSSRDLMDDPYIKRTERASAARKTRKPSQPRQKKPKLPDDNENK